MSDIIPSTKLKVVSAFPNYGITKTGRIWNYRKERWLQPTTTKTNYKRIKLRNSVGSWYYYVHRLVLDAFVGSCPDGMECRHLNGDPADNRLSNLKYGTHSENMYDAVQHKTHSSLGKFGEKHYHSKLSDYERRMIIYEYSTELFSQRKLARRYGITQPAVGTLVRGERFPFCKAVRK